MKKANEKTVNPDKFRSEQPLQTQFLSNVVFPIGKQTMIGKSEVKKEGIHKGKTMLRFSHESGVSFSMGMGDFRIACEKAGVSGCDSEGNILDVVSEKTAQVYTIAN
jgi:hypothetical protein